MKRTYLFAIIALTGISACSTKLDPQDRALLTETRNLAEQSVIQSSNAMAEAKAARASSEKAAADAAEASKKADRIFREAQKK